MRITAESIVQAAAATGHQCPEHPAFTTDNCPRCGTSANLGGAR